MVIELTNPSEKYALQSQALFTKLVFSTLLYVSDLTGKQHVNYANLKAWFGPSLDEELELYRSLGFLERVGVLKLNNNKGEKHGQ
jgi:hypothetical protein